MKTQFPYTKLPGVRRGFVRKAALWEGSDHLFSVSGTRFSENYRRFYYRDIQALVVQKRPQAGSVGAWLLTVLSCGIFALFASLRNVGSAAYRAGVWFPTAILAVYLIYRLILSLGYSCRCHIQTAVTREELPSLYRIWNARKALNRIRAKITEAQGTLAGDPQILAEEAAVLSPFQAPQPEAVEITAMQGRATSMNLTLLGCITLLVIAAFLFWYMDAAGRYAGSLAILMLNALLTLLAGGGFVWSLLRIYKIRAFHSLRNFLFAALAWLGLHVYFSSLFSRLYVQSDPFSMALSSPAFRHWFSLIDGSFSLGLGLFGVALIVFNWQNYKGGPTSNR